MTLEPQLSDTERHAALRAFDSVDKTFTPRRFVFGSYSVGVGLTLLMPVVVFFASHLEDGVPESLMGAYVAIWIWALLAPFVLFIVIFFGVQSMLHVGKERVRHATMLAWLKRAHDATHLSIERGGTTSVIPLVDSSKNEKMFRFTAELTPALHDVLRSYAQHVERRTCSQFVAHLLSSVAITPVAIIPRRSDADPWRHVPTLHALHAFASGGVDAALDALFSYIIDADTGPRPIGAEGPKLTRVATAALCTVERDVYRALDEHRRDYFMFVLSEIQPDEREAFFERIGYDALVHDLQRWLRAGGPTRTILDAFAWLIRVHLERIAAADWRGEMVTLLASVVESVDASPSDWSLSIRAMSALEGPEGIEALLPKMTPRFTKAANTHAVTTFDVLWQSVTEILHALGTERVQRQLCAPESPLAALIALALSHPNANYPRWKGALEETQAMASDEVLGELAARILRAFPVEHSVRSGGADELTTMVMNHPDTRIRADLLAMELVAPEVRRRIDAVDKLAAFPDGIDALERELPRVSEFVTIGRVARTLSPTDADAASRILIHCARHAADSDDRMEAVRLTGEVGALAAIPALQALAQSERRLRDAAERAVAQIQAREAAGASHGGLAIAAQEGGALSIDRDAGSGLALESSVKAKGDARM